MKCIATHCVAAGLGLLLAAGSVAAQGYGAPTRLPLPDDPIQYRTAQQVPVRQAVRLANDEQPTPAPEPVASPDPQYSEDYQSVPGHESASPSDLSVSSGCAVGETCYGEDVCDTDWMAPWCGGCNGAWFGSVAGLVLTRNKTDGFWTTYESNNNANQIQNTEDADADWRGGWLVSFGKWFGSPCDPCGNCCCGPRCGIGVTYFSTSPFRGSSEVWAADPANGEWVSSTIDMNDQFGPIEFPDGNEVDDYFDNSLNQTISRRDYIQSVEINFLSQYWQPNARCQVTWLAGVRWFRFDESLLYGATAGASTPTGSDYAFMDFDCTNDLVGVQLGARCDWYATERFSLFVTPKFGFYGNHIQTHNRVANGDGSELYDFSQDTTGVSFLGEVDLGASWQFSQHCRAFIGYKAIAVTGVALSDNQIPHYLAAADEFQQINKSGSLIVHGGFAGLEFCY